MVFREMEREREKTAAVKRRSCSTVVADFAREQMMDSCEARLRWINLGVLGVVCQTSG